MHLPRRWHRVARTAAGTAACLLTATTTASAQGLQLLGQTPLTGGGLGNVATVLTLLSPANTTNATGCVGPAGFTGCGFTNADVQQGQTQLRAVAQFPGLNAENFRLFFNAAEPGNDNTVTINALTVTLYGANNATYAASLAPVPVTLTSTLPGIGNYGYLFGLSPASYTAFNAFLTANPTLTIGIGASLSNASGGPETFSVGTVTANVVPEPSTYLLMAGGLTGLLWLQRRRRTGVAG